MPRFISQTFREGARTSARAMQSLSDALRRGRIWVAPPLEMRELPFGTLITTGKAADPPRIVKPTSITPNEYGYFPGKIQEYEHGEGWSDGADCHIVDANA